MKCALSFQSKDPCVFPCSVDCRWIQPQTEKIDFESPQGGSRNGKHTWSGSLYINTFFSRDYVPFSSPFKKVPAPPPRNGFLLSLWRCTRCSHSVDRSTPLVLSRSRQSQIRSAICEALASLGFSQEDVYVGAAQSGLCVFQT